jgi:hypothetical protein
MSLSRRFPQLPLFLCFLLLPGASAWAQETTGDSTPVSTPDSQAAVADSGNNRGVFAGESAGVVDSAQPGDTTRAKTDTIRLPAAADSSKSARAVHPVPVDSVLAAACSGPEPGTIAQDLLVVLFAPEAGTRERAAAARSVRGKLLSSPEAGVYYIRLRPGSGEAGLRAAADELSRMPDVRQVGSRSCPAPPPADTALPKSSNRAPSSRSSSSP